MRSKKGQLESPGKAKSRIKTFEKNLDCGHRLALTYASNQAGEVPPTPGYMGAVRKRYAEGMKKIQDTVNSVNPFHKAATAMEQAGKDSKPQDIGQKAYEDAVKRGKQQ